jgi:hypothetical protein
MAEHRPLTRQERERLHTRIHANVERALARRDRLMTDYYEREKQRAIQQTREAIARGRALLIDRDLSSLSPQEITDTWLAAVADLYGDDIGEHSLVYYGRGWYTRRVAHRFDDGSIGVIGGLAFEAGVRRRVMEDSIKELLRRAAAKAEGNE